MIACIPSKGRPNTKTHELFESVGIKTLHFVEPQDVRLYIAKEVINIEKNDMGIGYARQFIINYCKSKKIEWIVMCDDDINSFGYVSKKRCIVHDASIFHEMLSVAKKLPFEQYGISFRQYAWAEANKYSINTKTFTAAILINVPKITWEYTNTFKEDLQFLMDGIKFGNGVLKFNHFFFNCPVVGTNKGGCYDGYQQRKDEHVSSYIVKKYNGYAKIAIRKGRKDIKWDVRNWAIKHNKKIR